MEASIGYSVAFSSVMGSRLCLNVREMVCGVPPETTQNENSWKLESHRPRSRQEVALGYQERGSDQPFGAEGLEMHRLRCDSDISFTRLSDIVS